MTEKLNHNNNLKCILRLTDAETVKLDFDKTLFKWVQYWAFRTMKRFKLKGFIILKSSENCYHVVFDREVSWSENVKIMAWVSLLSQHRLLTKWFIMQCIKQASTLRVSRKKQKPSPRIVFRYGSQENQIAEFLKYRRLIKGIVVSLQNENVVCSLTAIAKT